MKSWHAGMVSALFCFMSVTAFAADTTVEATPIAATSSTDTMGQTKTKIDEAVPEQAAPPAIVMDPSLQMTNLEEYYITKGKEYTKVTELLESLPKNQTGLSAKENHYFRMNKKLTGDFFYHVAAYNHDTHVLEGSYFVAKDESCAWKLPENGEAVLIYGNGESLIKKTKVVFYPKKIAVGSYGIIRVHVPGMVPYDIKITSLNTDVANITDKMNIQPLRQGTADIVVDISIAGASQTYTEQIDIVDEADKSDRSSTSHRPSVGVGIGIGWGGGWHHHDGGIGIGIGPWW
ncbi:MAG: hypothetical protein LKF40_02110 [Megasphaera sp.]|jgi:hypothetical protein|nr:hypothetical protein [Megasphaera sp.]